MPRVKRRAGCRQRRHEGGKNRTRFIFGQGPNHQGRSGKQKLVLNAGWRGNCGRGLRTRHGLRGTATHLAAAMAAGADRLPGARRHWRGRQLRPHQQGAEQNGVEPFHKFIDSSTSSVEFEFTLALTPAFSPGERESIVMSLDNFTILVAVPSFVSLAVRRTTPQPVTWLKTQRSISPLLGERAGVRADNRFTIFFIWACAAGRQITFWRLRRPGFSSGIWPGPCRNPFCSPSSTI